MADLATLPRRLAARLLDPFSFGDALAGLTLQPSDLPGWCREARMRGGGE